MPFSYNEKVKISEKALTAGVFDSDNQLAWYESTNPFDFYTSSDKIRSQFGIVKSHPAPDLSTARSNAAGPLISIVQDLSSTPKRCTRIPTNYNTFVVLSVYNDFSSIRLDNWIQPQKVPQSDGRPSHGYSIKLFDGDPLNGGTEVLTTDGSSGIGSNKSVGWVFNYDSGTLLLSSDFVVNDPWVLGFRYIGRTIDQEQGILNNIRTNNKLIGPINNINTTFVLPRSEKFVHTNYGPTVSLYYNGVRMSLSDDYLISESVVSEGYDTIHTLFIPRIGDNITADWIKL